MTALSPPQNAALPERRVLIAFLMFVVAGGGASVAIRITYHELQPFWAGASRLGMAALIFWILVAARKIPLPKGRALLGAVIFGSLTTGLGAILGYWALAGMPASVFQILMALVPLLTIFLSAAHGIESITTRGIIGSLLAVGGIAVVVLFKGSGDAGSEVPVLRVVAVIIAAAFAAEGGVVLKSFPPSPPIMTNAVGMSVGTIFLAAASLVTGERWVIPSESDTWLAYGYLVLVVTVVAFMIYMFVLRNWTASGASYGFVLVPLVTVVVAATVAGEKITASFLVGAALVLAGVLVGALLPAKTKAKAVEECKDRSGQVLSRCV